MPLLIVALLLIVSAAPVPAGQDPAVADAAISGVVVDATTQRALEGATVTLSRGVIGGPARTFITDAAGRFVFTDLAAGTYAIAAQRAGYFDALYGDARRPALPWPISLVGQFQNPGTAIALAAHQWLRDARIPLTRPGSIDGSVVDERGEPLVKRFVQALTVSPGPGETLGEVAATALTDDRGVYSLGRLPRGRYVVVALPLDPDGFLQDAGAALAYPATYFPSAGTLASATPIAVEPGAEIKGVDLAIRPVATRRVSGRVDGPRDGIDRLRLRLVSADQPDLGASSQRAFTFTAPDGTFAFPAVPIGRYLVLATPSMSAAQTVAPVQPAPPVDLPGTGTQVRLEGGTSRPFWARAAISVEDRDLEDVVVPLKRAAQIRGRIVVDDPTGSTTLAGVHMVGRHAEVGSAVVAPQGSVEPDGEFVIDGVLSGQYWVEPYLVRGAVKSVMTGGADHTDTPLDLSTGDDLSGVIVTITAGATVRGAVRDARGAVASRAVVIYYPVDRTAWPAMASNTDRLSGSMLANGHDGSYWTPPLLQGRRYYVIAVSEAWRDAWQNPAFLDAASALATTVDLAWGQSKTVDLQIQEVRVP